MGRGLTTDFSVLEAETTKLGMALMVTKCKKAAILPSLAVMVPMTATQAQVDAIIETVTRMRRTA